MKPDPHPSHLSDVVVRNATSTDDAGLRRLCELEGRGFNGTAVLVAEVEGEIRAALPLDGSQPLGDPFLPTDALIELLKLRAGHLSPGAGRGTGVLSAARSFRRRLRLA
jgi:hypothetical protein